MDFPDTLLDGKDILFAGYFLDIAQSIVRYASCDLQFLFRCVVAHNQFHHEAVQLGFGKIVRPLLLYGVLCRHYEKRQIDFETLFANRYLTFLHHLQQCRLHLRRCTVDLIGQ